MTKKDPNGIPDSDRNPQPGNEHNPPDGNKPLPETLPRPTVYPAVLAFGACFLAWGILTSWIISVAGLVIFILGCAGWAAELCRGDMPD